MRFIKDLVSGSATNLSSYKSILKDTRAPSIYYSTYDYYESAKAQLFRFTNSSIERISVADTTFLIHTENSYEKRTLDTVRKHKSVFTDLKQSLESSDNFYDIGANIGIYTCFAGHILDHGKILAIDPHPPSYRRLQENIELNNIDSVTSLEAAIGTYSGARTFVKPIPDLPSVYGIHDASINHDPTRTFEVDCYTSQDLYEMEVSLPNIAKINVEGDELDVLRGISPLLQHEECRVVYCSVYPELLSRKNQSPEMINEVLDNLKFEFEILQELGMGYIIKATK